MQTILVKEKKKKMGIRRICTIGAGFVGALSSCVLAFKCPEILVTVYDHDEDKIMKWNSEEPPIDEPGLDDILKACKNKNLIFSSDFGTSIQNAEIIFICIGTPVKRHTFGRGKLSQTEYIDLAKKIAKHAKGEKIVVDKSSLPISVRENVIAYLNSNGNGKIQLLSNPEFLTEGYAIEELTFPEMVVIGGENSYDTSAAVDKLSALYERWIPKDKIVKADTWSSELCKMLVNAYLAQQISTMNALHTLCEAAGADVKYLTKAITLDSRIVNNRIQISLGFGGRKIKKDLQYLIYMCEFLGCKIEADYWQKVLDINHHHIKRFVLKITDRLFNNVHGKKIGILGICSSKNSTFTEDSPSVYICKALLDEGAILNICDPRVKEEKVLEELDRLQEHRNSITIFGDPYECASYVHAIILCTEYDEFKNLDYEAIYPEMVKPAFIFDGTSSLKHEELLRIGFKVESIGKRIENRHHATFFSSDRF